MSGESGVINTGSMAAEGTSTYPRSTLQVGYWDGNYWYPWDWGHYHYSYSYNVAEDKISKSFKIVQKLMELEIIKEISVPKFVELVNKISEIL